MSLSCSTPTPIPEPTHPGAVTTKTRLQEEKPNFLWFPPQMVAKQLTLMDAVSSGALGGWGGSSLCHQLPQTCNASAGIHDLAQIPFPTYLPWDLGNFLNLQAFGIHTWTIELDTRRTCWAEGLCGTMRWDRQEGGGAQPAGEGGQLPGGCQVLGSLTHLPRRSQQPEHFLGT